MRAVPLGKTDVLNLVANSLGEGAVSFKGTDESAHAFLRRETASWHRAVETAFEPFDLSTRQGLADFLWAQAHAVLPLEAELDKRDFEAWLPDWHSRRRSEALCADLASLGLPQPVDDESALTLDSLGRQIGATYVIEGSRLGGRLLARQVAESPDDQVRQVTAFLRHHVSPGAWPRFLSALDRSNCPPDALLEGATAAFQLFLQAATTVPRFHG